MAGLGTLKAVVTAALGVACPCGLPGADDAGAAVAPEVAVGVGRARAVRAGVGVAGVKAATWRQVVDRVAVQVPRGARFADARLDQRSSSFGVRCLTTVLTYHTHGTFSDAS